MAKIIKTKNKGIKKYQYKERALIRLINIFIKDSFKNLEKVHNVNIFEVNPTTLTDLDLKLLHIHKKLDKLDKMFYSKKIENFLSKRLSHITLLPDCQPFTIALVLLYFYQKTDIKKDFVIDFKTDDILEIIKEAEEQVGIHDISIKLAIDIFLGLYPDKDGFVEYLKIRNSFPFNLLKQKEEAI